MFLDIIVYFNDTKDFTTTSFTIENQDSYIGTYSVRAGYKDDDTSLSDPATKTLQEEISYELALRDNNTTYLNIGDAIDSSLYNGSLVVLKENGKNSNRDISPYLTITVTNSSGDIVTTISSDTQETYTITYTIDYNGFHDSISSKIVIRS